MAGLRDNTTHEILALESGCLGFFRITSAESPAVAGAGDFTTVTEWIAVKAKGGALTYDAACVAPLGDAPAEDDTLLQDQTDKVRLTTLVVKTGTAYAYYRP